MDRYTPIWSKIVDSSLWTEPDFVVKIFLTMLAKKDRDNIVRGNAFNIGSWARKSEAEAIEALEILSSPDKKRLEPQKYDGRRIEKVDEGWLILNGEYYQDMMIKANRREYKRNKQAEYRKKGAPITGEASTMRATKAGATVEQTDEMTKLALPDRLQEQPPEYRTNGESI